MLDRDTIAVLLTPGILLAFAGAGISLAALFWSNSTRLWTRVLTPLGQFVLTGGLLLSSLQGQQADKRAVIETLELLERHRGTGPSIEPLIWRTEELNGAGPIIFAVLFGVSLGALVFTMSPPGRAWARRGVPQTEEA